jgi:putative acetyltransferase
MIRKYDDLDERRLIDIWLKSSSLAHPFLDTTFVEKVKKDMKEIYLPNSETWVFEEDNTVVGFISMIGNEIGGLFVAPVHHSKGIGTKLVNFIRKNNKKLEVEVFKNNKIGRAFYDKYGFKKIREYLHEETKQDLIRMEYT